MATYIGTATSRIDGKAKVTGEAKYAGEFNVPGLAYGYVVESTIPRGRITRIDATTALQVGGVIDVLTHQHRPQMADSDDAYKDGTAPDQGSPYRPLYDDKVQFSGQPIALVVAKDWETAKFAASRLTVEYQQEAHVTDLHAQRDKAFVVDKPKKPRGDADRAFAAADVRHKGEYFIPTEHHNPMELFASTAIWEDDGKLTVYDKTQGVQNVQQYLCGVFGMQADEVRVLSPYMGGGFGSGLRPQYQVVLAVLAAHALKRPVRVVLSRQQMYALGHRPATIERLALGARADGTLEAITHEAIAVTSQYEEFSRNDTGWGDLLYTSPNAKFVHRLARLDVPTPCDMRAPGAATGVYALECAMDELAVALKIDPMRLRLQCYASSRDITSGPDDSPILVRFLRPFGSLVALFFHARHLFLPLLESCSRCACHSPLSFSILTRQPRPRRPESTGRARGPSPPSTTARGPSIRNLQSSNSRAGSAGGSARCGTVKPTLFYDDTTGTVDSIGGRRSARGRQRRFGDGAGCRGCDAVPQSAAAAAAGIAPVAPPRAGGTAPDPALARCEDIASVHAAEFGVARFHDCGTSIAILEGGGRIPQDSGSHTSTTNPRRNLT